jgi:hypothetical protein
MSTSRVPRTEPRPRRGSILLPLLTYQPLQPILHGAIAARLARKKPAGV